MRVNGTPMRTIWPEGDGTVAVIDQTRLPHAFEIGRLATVDDAADAIETMVVRGAPLIGATAAYGMALAAAADPSDHALEAARRRLAATRPTAVNLRWALDEVGTAIGPLAPEGRVAAAWSAAATICDDDAAMCSAI